MTRRSKDCTTSLSASLDTEVSCNGGGVKFGTSSCNGHTFGTYSSFDRKLEPVADDGTSFSPPIVINKGCAYFSGT